MIVGVLIYAFAVPLLVAAMATVVVRRVGMAPQLGWSVGVGLGYIAGHFALKAQSGGWAALRLFVHPLEARDWVPHAVLLAMAVTVLAVDAPAAWRRGIALLAALLVIGVPIRLLSGHVAQSLSPIEKVVHLAVLSLALAIVWLVLSTANANDQPILRAVLVAIVAAGSAVALASTSIMTGEACGVVASAVGGSGLVALESMRNGEGRFSFEGAAGVITCSLGSLIILGHYYNELPVLNAALLWLAILAAGGQMPGLLRGNAAWFDAAIRAVLCMALLAAAVAISLS